MDSNLIKQQFRTLRIVTLFSVTAALLSFAGMVASIMLRPQPMTILLPHHISAPYQLTYSSASRTYLSDAGAHLSGLYLNINPETSAWREIEILKWVHPAQFGQVQQALRGETRRVSEQRIISHFSIRSVTSDNSALKTAVDGVLTRWTGSRQLSKQGVRFVISWSRDDRGTVLLRDTELLVIDGDIEG